MNSYILRLSAFVSLITGFCISYLVAITFGFQSIVVGGVGLMYYLLFSFVFGKVVQGVFFSESEDSLNQQNIGVLTSHYNKPSSHSTTVEKLDTPSFNSNSIEENTSQISGENLSSSLDKKDFSDSVHPYYKGAPVRSAVPPQESEFSRFVKGFFAENALAKVGGILFFLGVLFLMGLIYTKLGPLGKMAIGFLLGFSVYFVGLFIRTKGFQTESSVLMGLGIVINYLVILSGRYLIGDTLGQGNYFIGATATFVLLIANSIFGIISAIRYESRNLLFFSFFIAYVTPILIGAPESHFPYSLLGYNLILTFGGFYLAYTFLRKQETSHLGSVLVMMAFLGGNFLALISPMSETYGLVAKIVSTLCITLIPLFAFKKDIKRETTGIFFSIGYIFLFLTSFYGAAQGIGDVSLFLIGLVSFGILSFALIYFFLLTSIVWLLFFLLLPFLYIFIGFFIFVLPPFLFIVSAFVFLYFFLLTFFFTGKVLSSSQKNLYFGTLFILGLITTILCGSNHIYFDVLPNFLVVLFSTFLFLVFGLYELKRTGESLLYPTVSIGSLCMLFPLLTFGYDKDFWSFGAFALYFFLVFFFPFLSSSLLKNQSKNFFVGIFAASLFLVEKSIELGNVELYTSLDGVILLGIGFIILLIAFFLYHIYQLKFSEISQDEEHIYNSFFTYIIVGFSFLFLGVFQYFGFSESGYYSLFALIEATILLFGLSIFKDAKIWAAFIGFFLIGLVGVFHFYFNFSYHSISSSVLFLICLFGISSVHLFIIGRDYFDEEKQNIYHFFHIVLSFLMTFLLFSIMGKYSVSSENLALAFSLSALSLQYTVFSSKIAHTFYLWVLSIFCVAHFVMIDASNLHIVIDYITSIIFVISFLIYRFFVREKSFVHSLVIGIYVFVITTLYVHKAFENPFIVTLYWGIFFSGLITLGIQKNIKILRTLGLYILLLTVGKIVLFDVWSGINNSLARVIALMFVGGLMISLSMLYKKLQSVSLKDDLIFEGEKVTQTQSDGKQTETASSQKLKENSQISSGIMGKLKDVDITGIQEIHLYFTSGKHVKIISKNIIRIVQLVLNNTKKTTFSPGELLSLFEYISKQYVSSLPEATIKKITDTLLVFVQEGGTVDVVKEK